jgi:phospholipid/cholesterol/gamma-HCH transport system substrate-binding protein
MPRSSGREATVGAFLVMSLIVLAVGVLAVGGQSKLFTRKFTYRAVFATTDGLIVGSPVKMGGVQVGAVTHLRLPTDPNAAGVEVAIGVERAYASRVRKGSQASLKFLQYLSGEKYIELTPGDPSQPPIPDGDLVPSAAGSRIFEQGEDIADNLNAITISLKQILQPLQKGEGLLGQAIQNPEFGKESLAALQQALKNIEAVTGEIRNGRGMVGRLVSDPTLGGKLDDLGKAITNLAAILDAVRNGEGAVGDLLKKGGASEQAVSDLRDAAASLKRLTARLESTDGLVGKFLNDTAYSNDVAAKLKDAVSNLAEITRKINEGEGTLGALVNNRTLYDSAEDVIAGVNDSRFARWMLRHYQKKGIEAPPPPPQDDGSAPKP